MGYAKWDLLAAPAQASPETVTTVIKFTATTTSQCHAMPKSWCGEYAKIQAKSANVDYFFTTDSAAACSTGIAATSDGATSTELGDYLASGDSNHDWIPNVKKSADGKVFDQYLCRQSDDDSGELVIRLLGKVNERRY